MVAVHQSLSGNVGAECVPAGLSALRGVRDSSVLPPSGRHASLDVMTPLRASLVGAVCLIAAVTPMTEFTGQTASGGPVIMVETTKGTFEFETYPDEAPRSVAHVVDLVKTGFYDGQRFHRVQAGFVIQWGDPQSRDPAKDADWGRGPDASSGKPIGVAEMSKKRLHTKG